MKDCKELIKDERYRNWVKGALGIQQTSKAVCEYVERKFSMYLESTVTTYNNPAIQYLTDDEYSHFRDESQSKLRFNVRKYVKLENGKCNWRVTKQKCQCQNTLEKLLCLHKSPGDIHLKNIDDTRKLSPEWAIVKIFMPRGNKKNKGPDETDPSAIFTVMNKCHLFTNPIKHRNIQGVIDARNALFHSPDSLVEKRDLETYFDSMGNLVADALNDPDNDVDLKGSIEESHNKIVKLKESDMTMTLFEDAQKAMRIKRKAVYYDFEQYLCDNDVEQLQEVLKYAEQVGSGLEIIRENLRIKEQEKQDDPRICKQELQEEIAKHKDKIRDLEERVIERIKENGDLKEQITNNNATIRNLEASINNRTQENGELQKEISKNKTTISELLQQQNNLASQLNEQKSDFTDVSKIRDDILQQLEYLQHKNELQRREIESLKWTIVVIMIVFIVVSVVYLCL